MEQEKELRKTIRTTLMEWHLTESGNHDKQDELVKSSEELVQGENPGRTIDEKNILDDKQRQGADKIFAKLNKKLS